MQRSVPVLTPSDHEGPGPSGALLLPEAWRQRIWVLDLVVAGAVFLYNAPIVPGYGRDPGRVLVLLTVSAVLCVPYVLRRRHPRAVFGALLAAASVQLLLGAPLLVADVMLLFAVYTLATREIWWVSLGSAVATVVWLLVAVLPRLGDEFLDLGQLGLLVAVTGWVWTWGTLVRVRRHHVAGLRERAEQAERERETNARIAVAEERARIAREFHDIVSHSLSVVVLMSDGAAAKVDTEPERARSAMLSVRDTGRSALAEMRRMLGVLRADEPGSHAPQPGIAQVECLVEQSRAAGLPVTLTIAGERAPLPGSMESTVYRLVQEALTNARRHGGPALSRVEVGLEYRPGEIAVRVTDDGRGTPSTGSAEGGHGLLGMRERVAAHGGTLAAGPRRGGGFEVAALLRREETR